MNYHAAVPMSNIKAVSPFSVVLITLLMADALGSVRVEACGNGESYTVSAGSTSRCCMSAAVESYSYTVDGGIHDDNIKVKHVSLLFKLS